MNKFFSFKSFVFSIERVEKMKFYVWREENLSSTSVFVLKACEERGNSRRGSAESEAGRWDAIKINDKSLKKNIPRARLVGVDLSSDMRIKMAKLGMTALIERSLRYYQYFYVNMCHDSLWCDESGMILRNIYDDAFEYTSTYWDDSVPVPSHGVIYSTKQWNEIACDKKTYLRELWWKLW